MVTTGPSSQYCESDDEVKKKFDATRLSPAHRAAAARPARAAAAIRDAPPDGTLPHARAAIVRTPVEGVSIASVGVAAQAQVREDRPRARAGRRNGSVVPAGAAGSTFSPTTPRTLPPIARIWPPASSTFTTRSQCVRAPWPICRRRSASVRKTGWRDVHNMSPAGTGRSPTSWATYDGARRRVVARADRLIDVGVMGNRALELLGAADPPSHISHEMKAADHGNRQRVTPEMASRHARF